MGRHGEVLTVGVVVVTENLPQAVFLEQLIVPSVVNVGVKQRCDLDVRVLLGEDAVVLHGFGNAGGRQDGMEHAVAAQLHPMLVDVAGDSLAVVRLLILGRRQVVLDALDDTLIGAATLIVFFQLIDRGHRNLLFVHELVVDSRLLRVRKCFLYGLGLGLLEGDHGTHTIRPESLHHLRVEAEDVLITDAICNRVAVQLISEQRGRGGMLLLVLIMDGRAGKAEEQRVRQGALDGGEHVTEGGAVRLIDDEDHALGTDEVQVSCLHRLSVDAAHLVQ
ncbi:hypothetical protein CIP107554_00691 [Corynebacterium diphtheriae]|nr:hypothetical protein CIP107554_00691 [Corynebacterium diphtheriae]